MILVDIANEPYSCRVHLNETAFFFISLNKISITFSNHTLISSSLLAKVGRYLFLNLPAS
jgi:hypothetical protein